MNKRLQEREELRKIHDFEFNEEDLVRYMLPIKGLTKKRYHYSKEYYKIDSKNGLMSDIIAEDGTAIVKPLYLLKK